MDPHPEFALGVKTGSHTKKGEKIYYPHIMKLSGESREGSQGLKNGLREQRKETGLALTLRG